MTFITRTQRFLISFIVLFRYVHSMSGDMLCGGWYTGDSCLQYKSGSWIEFPWKLLYGRAHHESWRSPSGEVILMGGWSGDGTNITENVTPLGSSEGFSLNEKSTRLSNKTKGLNKEINQASLCRWLWNGDTLPFYLKTFWIHFFDPCPIPQFKCSEVSDLNIN